MKSPIVAFCILFAWGSASSLPSAMAQGIGDSLIVNLKNGERVAIPLADIQKITFDLPPSGVISRGASTGHSSPVAFPNPLRTSTTIAFELPSSGNANVLIFDANGNPIRSLAIRNAQAGANEVVWDGLSDRDNQTPNGDYFYEVRFNGQTQTRKMVVLK